MEGKFIAPDKFHAGCFVETDSKAEAKRWAENGRPVWRLNNVSEMEVREVRTLREKTE